MDTPAQQQDERSQSAPTATAYRLDARGRLYAAWLCLSCAAVLALAVWLKPDSKGYGTHRQLGFGKCGMLVTTGLPCPTCGMTTAFSYTVRGRLIKAFMAQPAGLVLALGTIITTFVAGWSALRGRAPNIRISWLTPYRLFTALLVLLLGSWAFVITVGLLTGKLPDRG